MFKRACVERFTKILTCTNMYKNQHEQDCEILVKWLNLNGCAEPEQPLHECCFGPGSQKEATKYSKRAEKSLVIGKRHSQRSQSENQ